MIDPQRVYTIWPADQEGLPATAGGWQQNRRWLVLDVTDGLAEAHVVEGPVTRTGAYLRASELRGAREPPMSAPVLSSAIEWTQDLGDGRFVAMERYFGGYRATLVGFRGVGTTQDAALEDLLNNMQGYVTVSDDFARALASGGHLHVRLQQITQLVDHIDLSKGMDPTC